MDNKTKLFKLMQKINPEMTGLLLETETPADVKRVEKVMDTSTQIKKANSYINNEKEFEKAFEIWFSTLGLEPDKISKGILRTKVDQVLTKLGYR